MTFQETYNTITNSKVFNQFKQDHPDAKIAAGFFILDFLSNDTKKTLDYLDGEKVKEKDAIEEQCKHSSAMEKLSTDAERASIKYMQVKYLVGKEGEEFNAVVSGVTEFGMFVELEESLCEGLVSMRDLKDDHYELNRETFSLVGRKNGKKFQLGDQLRVRVRNVDLVKKQLDFELV